MRLLRVVAARDGERVTEHDKFLDNKLHNDKLHGAACSNLWIVL